MELWLYKGISLFLQNTHILRNMAAWHVQHKHFGKYIHHSTKQIRQKVISCWICEKVYGGPSYYFCNFPLSVNYLNITR